jgi:uncharacterized damage-inducible protein DinB
MPIVDSILMELNQEAATTRRVLERVPEKSLGWKPHPKSMSLGQLALHVATTPGGVARMVTGDAVELPQFTQPAATSTAELLAAFDSGIAQAKATLAAMDDARLMAPWSLKKGAQTLFTMPRLGVIRSIMLNHWYHHRGQLSVYLRSLDVPLPSIYGPSADENPFA